MAQQWQIDSPKVIDVGDDGQVVKEVKVRVVGGRVAIVTHDDSPTARIEVTEIVGELPLQVDWDGARLTLTHGEPGLEGMAKRLRFGGIGPSLTAELSISVPRTAKVSLTSLAADLLASGLQAGVSAKTVSGTITLSDLDGDVGIGTVSGNAEATALSGSLKVNTVSGHITVQRSELRTIAANTVSGDLTFDLTSTPRKVTTNAISGDVTLRVPVISGYDVSSRSASGQVVIDGTRLLDKQSNGGQMKQGDESLKIRSNTVSGNIVLLRSGPESVQ